MGFTSVRDLVDVTDRMGHALRANDGLSRLDWARLLIVTSVAFADSLIGGGADWKFRVGSDQESIVLLRSVQHILTRHVRDLIGNGLGTLPEGRNW